MSVTAPARPRRTLKIAPSPLVQSGSDGPLERMPKISRDAVERALAGTGYSALRTIDVRVDQGKVVLRGRVASYYLKQMAQATILRLEGVSRLINEIIVCREPSEAPSVFGN